MVLCKSSEESRTAGQFRSVIGFTEISMFGGKTCRREAGESSGSFSSRFGCVWS